MADEASKSLYQRLQERRAAIDAGNPAAGSVAAGARDNSNPPKPPPPAPMRSKAAQNLPMKPGENPLAYRRRQIDAAIAAGEF